MHATTSLPVARVALAVRLLIFLRSGVTPDVSRPIVGPVYFSSGSYPTLLRGSRHPSSRCFLIVPGFTPGSFLFRAEGTSVIGRS